MFLDSSFTVLLQGLAVGMTSATFTNFDTLITGWVFASKRTVTGMLLAAGVAGKHHHAAYHRFFSQAQWSRDALGLAVFRLLEGFCDEEIQVAIDDTLARKRGLKMFGTGMHHDPLLSSRGMTVTNWGHCWVVLGVLIRFPLWPKRVFCLPILFRLYLNKKRAKQAGRVHRTKPELAIELLRVLCKHRENRRFHAVVDSAYGGHKVLEARPRNCEMTSRLRLDARLYGAPPAPVPGRKGRPRKRGDQLPTPAEMLQQRSRHIELDIYGRQQKARVCDAEARLFALPGLVLRVVAVEALAGGRGREAFYSTHRETTAEQVLTSYAMRWSIEVAFRDAKQHLGFEEPQGWTRRAVERTAPIAMLLYSLIVRWYCVEGHRHHRPLPRPWYTAPHQESFADMLATLRRRSLRESISAWAPKGPGSQKIVDILERILALAA
jgi:SRSO17 transposase